MTQPPDSPFAPPPFQPTPPPPPPVKSSRPWWRRTWAWVTAVALVALFIGIGIGGSGNQSSASTTNTPGSTPTTVTVTKAATGSGTPAACLRAITDAEKIGGDASAGFNFASKYPSLIPRAALAGEQQDAAAINAITTQLRGISSKLGTLGRQTEADVQAFNTDKVACRTAG